MTNQANKNAAILGSLCDSNPLVYAFAGVIKSNDLSMAKQQETPSLGHVDRLSQGPDPLTR